MDPLSVLGACAFFASALFVFVFALWFGSTLSGWRRLAAAWPMPPGPATWSWGHAFAIGRMHFRGVVAFAPTEKGLGIRLMPPLSAFHPPVLLPWDQMERSEEPGAFGPVLVVRLPRGPGKPLRFAGPARRLVLRGPPE